MPGRQPSRRISPIGLLAIFAGVLQVETSLEMFAQLLASRAEMLLTAVLVYAVICAWLLAYTLIRFHSTSLRIPAGEKSFLEGFLIFVYILAMVFFYGLSRGVETETGLLHRFVVKAMEGAGITWTGGLLLLDYIKY